MYSILRCYRCYMLQTVTEHPRRDTHSRPPGEARQKEPTERAYMTDVRTPLVVYHAAPLIPSPAVPRGAGGVEQQRWAAGLPPPPPRAISHRVHRAQRTARASRGRGWRRRCWWCKKINRLSTSTGHTHDTPTENNTPDTDTHAHDKNNTPNPQTPACRSDICRRASASSAASLARQ